MSQCTLRLYLGLYRKPKKENYHLPTKLNTVGIMYLPMFKIMLPT